MGLYISSLLQTETQLGNGVTSMATAPDPRKHGSKQDDITSTEQPIVQPVSAAPAQPEQPELTMSQPYKHQQPLPCIVTTSVDGGEDAERDTVMLVAGEAMGSIGAATAEGVGHSVSLEAATTAAATATAAAAVAAASTSATTTTIVKRNTERMTTTSGTMTPTTSTSTTAGPQQRPSRVDQVEAQRSSTSSDQTSPKRNSAHIMEFFEEQEKSFQEHFRTLPVPIKVKKHRSPSPSMMRQSVGLDHLDNLVRLMEQLTTLRDENNRLKKKCAYLESTKYLLQVRSDMSEDEAPLGYMSLPSKSKQKQQKAMKDSREAVFPAAASDSPRHRLSSGDSSQHLEIIETASDQTPKRPKTAKLYKRSFSTGSLEIPSDVIEQDNSQEMTRVIVSDYNGKDSKSGSKSPGSKKKSCKFSKWARVKKILTGQKTTVDDSDMTRKSLKNLGKGSSQLPQQSESSTQELTVPIVGLTETRSMDSGVSSGVDGDGREGVRTSTSSGGPPSPSALTKDAPADALDTGTEWWRWREKTKHTSVSKVADSQGQYLNVKVLVRRQSSPSLVAEGGEESDKTVDGDGSSPRLHRSASYKIPGKGEEPGSRERKMHKTAWGRVKGIIHTKKDSVKKKHKKSEKTIPTEEPSETDTETECFSYGSSELAKKQLKTGSESKPSTPQLSPSLFHQQSSIKSSGSESSKSKHSSARKKLPHSGKVDVEALVGGMTEDFTKKMKQWEELKCMQATGFAKGAEWKLSGSTIQPILKDATKRTVEWEQTKGKGHGPVQKLKWESGSLSEKVTDGAASPSPSPSPSSTDAKTAITTTTPTTTTTTSTTSISSTGTTTTITTTTTTTPSSMAMTSASTSPAMTPSPVNVDELQRNLTESFSRKIQEWESIKYRKEGSPLLSSSSRSRKEGKYKLKKSKSEKEKDKEKEKEKEKSSKSEKSKGKDGEKSKKGSVSAEKGRQRRSTSKSEKEQAGQLDFDPKLAGTMLGPLAEYKITDEFAHKLYEWEEMKGLSHELSAAVFQVCSSPLMTTSTPQQQPPPSSQPSSAAVAPTAAITSTTTTTTTTAAAAAAVVVSATEDEMPRGKQQKQKPSPLTLTCSWDSPDEASPVDRFFLYSSSETSFDESGTTEQSMTKTNIISLENAHHRLLQDLEDKKQEYVQVQESVRKLHGKLEKFKDAHSKEIVRFRKEMLLSKKPMGKLREQESGALYNTLQKLEGKIQELENSGEKLQLSMESAAMCKLLSMEGEENISSRLVELMEQMKFMLAKASQEEEVSKKSSALSNFEKFYCHAMQLQIQMNNLRLSHLERNKEIMEMKRQLLLQEVNNLLLQADITRRESELYQFQEARRTSQLKRWNTYHGGTEQRPRVANRRECEASPPFHRFVSMKERSKELYRDADMQSTRETSLPDTFDQGGLKQSRAGSLTEIRFDPKSTMGHINGSGPQLQYRSSSTPFMDSLVPSMEQTPIRMAPEGETHRTSFISTLSPSDAELISRIPDGASQEIEPITTPATISHDIHDSDQSRLQISFTISLPTMNVQIPQTITTSPHETSSISSQCVLCKTASVQRHVSGTAAIDTMTEPTTAGLGASTSEQIGKFHQGETLADWLKREPKCPELLLPECPHSKDIIAVQQSMFGEELPTETSSLEEGQTSKQKGSSSPYFKPTVKSKAAPVCRDQSISQTYPRQPTEGQQSSPNVPFTAQAEKSDKKSSTFTEDLPSSSDKKTHRDPQTEDRKIKSGKSPKREKQGPSPESPALRLSQTSSPTGPNVASPPQVGVVSPIRRLKPATELLEECQKYRLGHLAHHTRGYLRGARLEDPSKKVAEEMSAKRLEKENISEGYVEVVAKRLSGEGMPAQSLGSSECTPKAGSVISLHSSDSPRSLTKFGSHIFYNTPSGQAELHPQQKLSSWVEAETEPGKEQLVEPAAKEQPVEPTTAAAGVTYRKKADGAQEEVPSALLTTRRRSLEVPRSSESQIELQSYSRSSMNLDGRSPKEGKPDSTISVSNSFSLPVLSSGEAQGNGAASRSATCSALSEILSEDPAKTPQQPSSKEVPSIKQIGGSIFYVGSLESSLPEISESVVEKSSKKKGHRKQRTKAGQPASAPPPPLPPPQPSSSRRTGKTKKGTIGELCMQSMTFDLGISTTTATPKGSAGEKEGDEAEESSLEQREEGAAAAAVCKGPPETEEVIVSEDEESLTSLQSSDKRKPRSRFFDSNWFCKSKKLFKVSK
ncbi:Hypothetical predicted protein [Octopus vulgaris]|uniref:Uncharacterized protein n=1 Tax=Octopus vulgaris TaxID=6645 RepID=A0AA36BTJ5_OCTVU|nr:Hypothetical predicted protein [Octopus vulgaris]